MNDPQKTGDTVVQFRPPSATTSEDIESVDVSRRMYPGGPSGPGGGDMERRVSALEGSMAEVRKELTEIKIKLARIEGELSRLPGYPGLIAIMGALVAVVGTMIKFL